MREEDRRVIESIRSRAEDEQRAEMFVAGGAMDVFLVDSNSDGNDEIKRKLRTVASRNDRNKSTDAGNAGDDMNTWKSSQEHLNSQDELDPTNLMHGDDGISRHENS